LRFTKAAVAGLVLPKGKQDAIFFDDALPGLGIRLRAGGKRTWIFQFRANGLQKRLTLGDVRKLDIEAARRSAKRHFAAVTLGGDPVGDKAEAKTRAKSTFGALADRYIDFKRQTLRPSSIQAMHRHLMAHWKPLHRVPIHRVSRRDIAAQIGEIAKERGGAAALMARASVSGFMAWCVREGFIDANPVIGTNKPITPVSRDRVLDGAELAAIWLGCENAGQYGTIVRLLMLTGARRDEIGGLRWSEIDMDGGVLCIPGARTKNHRDLLLPLPPSAVAILEAVTRRESRDLIFGRGGGSFSGWDAAKTALDARIATAAGKPLAPWRLHDVRRSVATHMAELGVQPHIIEAVLSHVSGHKAGVAGIYNRAPYGREVKAALALWADHVRSLVEGTEPMPKRNTELPA
jgi:integrase